MAEQKPQERTVAPASAALWANFLLIEPPALNRAMSTSPKLQHDKIFDLRDHSYLYNYFKLSQCM